MLISPPFLPPRGNLSEDQWLDRAMTGGAPGAGAYPVSARLDWHGGVHLTAPMNGNVAEPVRAIANGTVVFIREPRTTSDPRDPLNYAGGYTSDGVVVIRHETEIGANAQDEPVTVRFYSVYHHLHSIRPTAMVNRPIWRKDEIGQAGHIYGAPNQIHFEIRCDEENLRRLTGRTMGDLPLDRDGRTDAVYGEAYFYLPVGTSIYGQQPLLNSAEAMAAPPQSTRPPTAPVRLQPIARTTEAMVVGVRHANGMGPERHRGDAFVTSYRLDGTTIGNVLSEPEAEYRLYQTSTAINRSYPAGARPSCSALMELIRFGRTINTDALTPADVPHWRQISHVNGTGWANLNAIGVHKFSDADFPHWKGWRLIADDTVNDARCDSPTLKSWLDQNRDGRVLPTESVIALGQAGIAARMSMTICRIPCEWNEARVNTRWQWLQARSEENPEPMSSTSYAEFTRHVMALCIPLPELHEAQWAFNPKAFIKHFRTCGWLSRTDLATCLPRRSLEDANLTWATAWQRAQAHSVPLSRLFRKYLGHSRQRQIHMLCQIYTETGLLRTLIEDGSGERHPYGPFYGRGYIQLTWAENYEKYGTYQAISNHPQRAYSDPRITTTSTHPVHRDGNRIQWFPRYDPALIGAQTSHAANSSGYYWITKSYRGTNNINRACDLGVDPRIIAFTCWLINGGSAGYANRQQSSKHLINILLDDPLIQGSISFQYPPLSPSGNPTLCRTFPPAEIPFTQIGTTHHDRQVP